QNQTDRAEDLDRRRRVAGQELHGRQIEERAQHASRSILRFSGAPRTEVHLDLRNTRSLLGSDRGDKAMHLAIEGQAAREFASIGLQRASVVVEIDAGDTRDDRVGGDRWYPTRQSGALPAFGTPSAHQVVAFVKLG